MFSNRFPSSISARYQPALLVHGVRLGEVQKTELRNLFHAGLVSDRREGLWVYYSLRRFEPGLVHSTLRAIKADLRDAPDAEELCRSLEAWLANKARGEGCSS